MLGPSLFRDMLIVARFELLELLRTRRVLIVLALYLLGGLAASRGFIEMLSTLEQAVAQTLGAATTLKPGALTQQLLQDETYRRPIRRMFTNPETVDFLLGLPPIALFFAWSTFTFVPVLVTITASDTVSQELQSRGMRFLTLRTGRVELVLGKALGQALLMAVVIVLTGLVYVLSAAQGLMGFEWLPTIQGVLLFSPRVILYCLPFLALSVACSMSTHSTILARALSLISLMVLWALSTATMVIQRNFGGSAWLEGLNRLTPFGHREGLWEPTLLGMADPMLNLLALTGIYLAVGLMILRRRDV